MLAKIPALARARTLYDDITGELSVTVEGGVPFSGKLTAAEGRTAFELWLFRFLEGAAPDGVHGPLKVLVAPGRHRFADSRKGFISVVNLESVRNLEHRLGKPVDPARFRANVLVEGWAPWSEHGQEAGTPLRLADPAADVGNLNSLSLTELIVETGIHDAIGPSGFDPAAPNRRRGASVQSLAAGCL